MTGSTIGSRGVRELLDLAERVARQAGDLVLERRRDVVAVSATKSSRTDPVTAVDLASEALLVEELTRARPRDGILGEEGSVSGGESGLTWVVDPIDGTVNYLYGLPHYAVSVAVVDGPPTIPAEWTVVAGCVVGPALGDVYTAGRGLGAYRNGARLTVAEVALDRALVATGFGYTTDRRARQARIVATLLPRVRDIRRLGSAALDLCGVAAGTVDAFYEEGLNPWDLAAGSLVAQEAGAVVLVPPGPHPADSGAAVVAAPGLARELQQAVSEPSAGPR